ncbi:MAG: hypothetical protein KDA73_01370 [Rhodobacteraceae bacterium]|nr:hypothetical protein [Paracoccaceae bacterium]
MADTIKVFDFEYTASGALVVVRREPLCPGCMSDGEVDAQIALLKEDLDAVAVRMKRAIRREENKPLTFQ